MIVYDLKCANGHAFEGWFEDRQAFLSQKKRGLISCPACNDTDIAQLPSRFAIRASQDAVSNKADASPEKALEQLGSRKRNASSPAFQRRAGTHESTE